MIDKNMLLRVAEEARGGSYCPYSNMAVGAALLAEDGKIYTGANVENASYPAGICAERAALVHAINSGARKFVAIAICGGRRGEAPAGFTPCGICRQALSEHSEDSLVILVANGEGFDEYTLGELLPHSFGGDKLV